MALPGLRLCIILGWSSGIIFLRKPWGTPEFRWFCIPLLLWFILGPIFMYLNVDTLYHAGEIMRESDISKSKIDILVVIFLYLQLFFSNTLLRWIFLWKAKKLADLLGRLQRYTKAKALANSNSSKGCCSTQVKFNMDLILTWTVFTTTILLAAVEGSSEVITKGNSISWNSELMGPVAHAITYTLFFVLPMMLPAQISFTIIVNLTQYLSTIFDDYCSHVMDTVGERKWMGMSIVTPLLGQQHGDEDVGHLEIANGLRNRKKHLFFTDKMRVELVSRFEVIWEVFDLAHEIMSPMALVLLAGASIDVVMEAYEIILLSEDWISKLKDTLHLINFACFFWLLQCGQRIADKIQTWKRTFEDTLVQLSEDTHHLERQTVKDVLSVLKFWDWKFTALDFFVIDRKLASGVVSLIMTYVVVLVQLKVSDAPGAVINRTEKIAQ